jgi:hypothetical protein
MIRTETANPQATVTEPTEHPLPRCPKWLAWLLVIVPLWLIASAGYAVWRYHDQQKKAALIDGQRFAKSVSMNFLADDLRKFAEIIGERNGSSETARRGLKSASTMIEGTLGPSNTGYEVRRTPGPSDWPLLQVGIHGKNPTQPAVWVIASYDSRPGSPGIEANGTGVCATLAAAQALAGDNPSRPIRFLFVPHGNDPESPVLEVVAKISDIAKAADSVLVVEAMGGGETLWLSSRDTAAKPLGKVDGLGMVRGAEVVCLGNDSDLSSLLFEAGLPAVRVSTRAMVQENDPDHRPARPEVVAASAGRLVELIRRCAADR